MQAFPGFSGGDTLVGRDPTVFTKLGISFKLMVSFLGIYSTEVEASLL